MIPRDSRLNPYQKQSNSDRLQEIMSDRKKLRPKTFVPGLAIVILNLNKPELIYPLLKELVRTRQQLASEGLAIEIFVGDTGSTDQAVLQCYDELSPSITVIRNLKYHFSQNNTEVFFQHVNQDKCLFMNNDIVFQEDSSADVFRKLMQRFESHPEVGILGSALLYDDRRIQHLGIDFFRDDNLRGLCYHPMHQAQFPDLAKLDGNCWTVPAVTGAFLAIRSPLFQSVGGFDPKYDVECQDVDLCLRSLRSGMTNEIYLTDKIVHLENATRPKGSEHWGDRQRFVRRWTSFIEAML